MDVNWWNVAGLVLDILGVLGVGFVPALGGAGLFSGSFELSPLTRFFYRLSWGGIVLGFMLQLVGTRQRLAASKLRKAGFWVRVSTRALIILYAVFSSLAQ